MNRKHFLLLALVGLAFTARAQKVSTIATDGWANNSVNTVIFRKNSLVTFGKYQYAAYYDKEQYLVLAKRTLGQDQWQTARSAFKGDIADAHKSISIMVDGAGYLHVAWGHHNAALNYARSVEPGSLQLSAKQGMTGSKETSVTYPEFYKMADGNLLFFYRDGSSGRGDLILNAYNTKQGKWTRLQNNLIDGEGQRSAYWQITADKRGVIHLSWVWRETPDVASNHDMAYACSKDGGKTWQKSTGEVYSLPITAATAEYACKIPQHSELMNQTTMFADADSHPFIATYWRGANDKAPQYHIIYNVDGQWRTNNLSFHQSPFSLSGTGTKQVPISRPQIVAWNSNKHIQAALIFRDQDRGNKVSLALSKDILKNQWQVVDIYNKSVGSWEPTLDTELWKNKQVLNLFLENVTQIDGEGKGNADPQPVQVLEWVPDK